MQTPEEVRAAYDTVAREYAERFSDELDHKPRDRELLSRFARLVRPGGIVLDLGCGSGQTTGFLAGQGASVLGVDLSPAVLEQARQRFPGIAYEPGDMLALAAPDASIAGVVAFYGIVHFTNEQLRRAIGEIYRVLEPRGHLLLAFHAGAGVVRVDEFLGKAVSLDFAFFDSAFVQEELRLAGFAEIEVVERHPYPTEYPSRRAYVSACKPE